MNDPHLDQLKPDALFELLPVLPPAAILRRALQRIPVVQQIRWAIRRGKIGGEAVRAFAAKATEGLERAKLLSTDISLAALAVALEASGNSSPKSIYAIWLA